MLNDPLPIMDLHRVVEIQEKPRLKYIKNEEEYRLHHNTTYDKFTRGNQHEQNRNFSLINFTIENTKQAASQKGYQNQGNQKQQCTSLNKQKKKVNRTKQGGGGQLSIKQSQLQQRQQEFQDQQNDKNISITNTGEELQWGEQDYRNDHECFTDQQSQRCKECNSVMKYIYHSGDATLQKPFSIYYVDYYKIFSRKMECNSLPKSKQKEFLMINYLPYMREWSFYILDRPKYFGVEEFIYNNALSKTTSGYNSLSARGPISYPSSPLKNQARIQANIQQNSQSQLLLQQIRLPFSLSFQFPQTKPVQNMKSRDYDKRSQSVHQSNVNESGMIQSIINADFYQQNANITLDFETFSVLGNYESSNISHCTVDKQESKCQILLRSDTNTKGCLHWFMFTVSINQISRPSKRNVMTASQMQERVSLNEGDNLDQDQLSCGNRWIVIDNEEEDDSDQNNPQNNSSEKTIQFSILNNQRNGYLYREGMQIAVFDSTKKDKGWHRAGDNIFYYRSNVDHQFFQNIGDIKNQGKSSSPPPPNQYGIHCHVNNNNSFQANSVGISSNSGTNNNGQAYQNNQQSVSMSANINPQLQQSLIQAQMQVNNKRGFQTMDFSYNFNEVGQRVTFAYCYPYTFSDFNHYLESHEQKLISSFLEYQNLDTNKKQFTIKTNKILYKKTTIAASRLGLPIILLKITSSKSPKYTKNRKKKKVIFIISRQHPGETPASFVCEGFISYLLSDTIQSKYLLDNYIFKIVPMMNPDGVVIGNSRCNLSGSDLNRKWDNPDPILHPEVFEVKKEIKKSHLKREVAIFCDIHGHSMKKHSFFYGCNKASDGGASSWTQVRLIPRILAKKSSLFSLGDCKFRVTEDKKNTARVICWNELKISNSFTLETSFFGYDDLENDGKATHFTIQDLDQLGRHLCESILEYTLVMELLMAELVESRGWLKPYRLIQVTGESAQNKIIRNIKQQKKIDKQQRTQANLTNLQQERERQSILIQSQIRQREKRCLTPSILNANDKHKSQNTSQMQSENRAKSNFSLEDRSSKNQPYLEDEAREDNPSQIDFLTQLCPSMKNNWRDYFGKEELEKNFKKIDKGDDPNEQESVSGSDSEAEIDIFNGNELQVSNEAKNRKKAKKKRSSLKKDLASHTTTIDMKMNNNTYVESVQTSALLDPAKKKKSSTAAQSLERNRWNPSPLIQSFKQQLEMKKQQLKKQSYPIAKVGQSFQSAYQNTNNTDHFVYQSTQASQPASNPAIPQQILPKGQVILYQPQVTNSVQPNNDNNNTNLAKNSVNSTYLERKKVEMQQQQQQQQQQQLQQQQQGLNSPFHSRNSQGMIYQGNTGLKYRKSLMGQIEEKSKGITSSNSEAATAFRLTTSDIQSMMQDKVDQNMPNSNSSVENYAIRQSIYQTNLRISQNQVIQQTQSNQYSQSTPQANQSLQSQQTQQSESKQKQYAQTFYQSELQENHPICNHEDQNQHKLQAKNENWNEQDNILERRNRVNSFQRNNNLHPHQNKVKNPKPFIVDDDNDEENQDYVIENQHNLQSPNIQIIKSDNFPSECFDILAQSQRSNQLSHYQQSSAGRNDSEIKGSYSDLKKKQSQNVSEFNSKNKYQNQQIPHNFISTSSSKKELQPLYLDDPLYSQYSTNNIINKNQQFSSSNSNSEGNTNPDEQFNHLINNMSPSPFIKEIQKNASNFEKKIRVQTPLRQVYSPEKQNQKLPQVKGQNMSRNMINSEINNSQNCSFQRNQEKILSNPFNLQSTNRSFGMLEKKGGAKKYRARSINEGKVQQSNYQLTYGSNFDKMNTSIDQQRLQMYLQENNQSFIPFKNFSSYNQPQSFANSNNIRIRKLNIQ